MTDGSVDPKHTPYDILSVKDAEKRFFNNSIFFVQIKRISFSHDLDQTF